MEKKRGLLPTARETFSHMMWTSRRGICKKESKEKPLLKVGDFNCCYLDISANHTKQFLEANNFPQLIREPTHQVVSVA
jgi:exonuclease III